MLTIKKKDKVMVLSGDYKGKTGEVLKIFPDEGKAIVSKINIAKKHRKSTQRDPGGIVDLERPIYLSKLALLCPKCNQAVRAKRDKLADGKKVRLCRKCGEVIL